MSDVQIGSALSAIVLDIAVFDEFFKELVASGALPDRIAFDTDTVLGRRNVTVRRGASHAGQPGRRTSQQPSDAVPGPPRRRGRSAVSGRCPARLGTAPTILLFMDTKKTKRPRLNLPTWAGLVSLALAASLGSGGLAAQVPIESEVRQIVTFSFLPGKSGEALAVFRDRAIPLYERDEAMRSFRGFREVESPIQLDLIVVSAFAGMAGMDESNAGLRALAEEAGTSIGAIYGGIGALSSGHTDQFVEMLPALGTGDASSRRLTAFVWYRVLSGQNAAFEQALERTVVPHEELEGIASATGRFLVSDGWSYLRFLAFDSLGDYHAYWSNLRAVGANASLAALTTERREVIVAGVPELSVRE